MPRRQNAELAFGELLLSEPPLTGVGRALTDSLVQGTKVTRYDRTWHMAPWTQEGRFIVGRIGFDVVGETETWNDELGDFVPSLAQTGQTSPFAIDLRDDNLSVAFQVRRPVIKPQTFRGNFQALLREAGGYEWIMRLRGAQQDPLELWLRRVSRITKVRIHARRPNPRYPSKQLEDFFEGAKLGAVNVVVNARDGESIDIESDGFLRDSLRLAERYGSYQVTGVTPAGPTPSDTWKSSLEGQAASVEVPEVARHEDVPPANLRQSLQDEGDG